MQKVVTKPTILVTGATGQQGGAVARELLKHGITFRALSRSTQKLNHLIEQGAQPFQGTLHEKEALSGIKQAFLVTTPFEEGMEAEIEQGINFVNAAKECGVEHLVFTSVCGADTNSGIPHFETKWVIEQHIKASGIPATILRPVFFMENFGSPWFFPDLEKGKLSLPVRTDVALQMVCLEVIGKFAYEAFNHPSEYIGQTLELASDQLTFSEAMKKISSATGKTYIYEQLSANEGEAKYGADFAKMFSWFNTVGFSANVELLRQKGVPLTTFEEYLSRADWIKKLC